jgi:hypothetical protein
MSAEVVIPRDLAIDSEQTYAGNLFVNGWVTIRSGGRLACQASVQCLGVSVGNGGALQCQRLTTNVLELARSAKLEVTQVSARVVQHDHFALRDLIDAGLVKADYIQHVGVDEYVRGNNPLADKYFEARADAMFVIRRVIKSPKLAHRLDALQVAIGL